MHEPGRENDHVAWLWMELETATRCNLWRQEDAQLALNVMNTMMY